MQDEIMTENLQPAGHDQLELMAVLGLASAAALFVTEPETWPVFTAWMKAHGGELHSISLPVAQLLAEQMMHLSMTTAAAGGAVSQGELSSWQELFR